VWQFGMEEAAEAALSDGGPRMQGAVSDLARLVPTVLSILALFVLLVAGSTIGYLVWRAGRGASLSERE
jgi:hypothetical protein